MLMKEIRDSQNIVGLMQAGMRYLHRCDVPEARAEADLILAHVLNTTRDRLYADRDIEVTDLQRDNYSELLKRRGQREPLAYLLKVREFMGLEFYVDNRVLIPRPETELLVEKTLELGKTIGKNLKNGSYQRVLDLCTGSGAIAVSIAHFWPEAVVVAADISPDALAVAKLNAARMNVAVDFCQGDLFQAVEGERYNIIVSNPPYVSEAELQECSPEVRQEPLQALIAGEDGLDYYRRIAREADGYLRPDGVILMEIGYDQGPSVKALFAVEGYQAVIFKDYAGLDRIVLARKE